MNPAQLRDHCLSFTGAEETFPFGPETSVFKVGGKMFALARGFVESSGGFMFKTSNMAYAMLIGQGVARPAPYVARAKWVQLVDNDALPDPELAAYLDQAHALVVAKLTRKARKELRLG